MSKPKKPAYPTAVTPVGVLAFPYLVKPDTDGKWADHKYKAKLVFAADTDLSALEAAARRAWEMEWGKTPKVMNWAIRDGDDMGKEEFEGKLVLSAKSMFKPTLIDLAREHLGDDSRPRAGDRVRFSVELVPHTAGGSKAIAFRLRAVQLVERRAPSGGGDYSSDFGDDIPVPKESVRAESVTDDEDDF